MCHMGVPILDILQLRSHDILSDFDGILLALKNSPLVLKETATGQDADEGNFLFVQFHASVSFLDDFEGAVGELVHVAFVQVVADVLLVFDF